MVVSMDNEDTKARLPGALSWLKAELGCSWSGLARQMGVDYTHLGKIRRGNRLPTTGQSLRLFKLASTAKLNDGFLERALEGWEEPDHSSDYSQPAGSS